MYKIKEVLLDVEVDIQVAFLNKHNLDYDNDIEYSILVYDRHEVIGTASVANNVMKCFAINIDYTGQNITGLMFNHLIQYLNSKHITHYFVFTTPENEEIFKSFNMNKNSSNNEYCFIRRWGKYFRRVRKTKRRIQYK